MAWIACNTDSCPGAVDEQGAQVGVTALGDAEHSGLTTRCMLPGDQTEPGAQIRAAPCWRPDRVVGLPNARHRRCESFRRRRRGKRAMSVTGKGQLTGVSDLIEERESGRPQPGVRLPGVNGSSWPHGLRMCSVARLNSAKLRFGARLRRARAPSTSQGSLSAPAVASECAPVHRRPRLQQAVRPRFLCRRAGHHRP